MSKISCNPEIIFSADKVYVHHWPLDSQKWIDPFKIKVQTELNQNPKSKTIRIDGALVKIDNCVFEKIKKIGITVPLFKKEITMVFEGCFEDFYCHVHVTSRTKNYLEIFNRLIQWRDLFYPDSSY